MATSKARELAYGIDLQTTSVDARINLQTGANLDLSQKSTTDLSEGTNLYYTDARVDARARASAYAMVSIF